MTAIEVIINCHNEGELLVSAFDSVVKNVEHLQVHHEVDVVISLVLDKPDDATEYFANLIETRLGTQVNVFRVDFGDLGLSRNFGVNKSQADFIAFVDADDLWGYKWLTLAFELQSSFESSILHPEISYYFGSSLTKDSHIVARHIGTNSKEFNAYLMTTHNYWTSACFAPREIYLETPYRPQDKHFRIGMEDWTFNLETFSKGREHIVVPGAVHFIRDKPLGSMRQEHAGFRAMHYPLKYL